MARNRVIVEFDTANDAKKVEETVKTGYAEPSIESLFQWIAVEEDLEETYGRLSESSSVQKERSAFRELREESKTNVAELSRLLKSFEALDNARVRRIEVLAGLIA
jgi:hypothetical protein